MPVVRLPMPTDCCGLVLVLLVGLAWFAWCWRQRLLLQSETTTVTATIQRLLKPRTPHDCPLCRQQLTAPATTTPTPPTVTPWRERKSRRGAPKRITTQGFACPNRRCTYYHISDAQLHARCYPYLSWIIRKPHSTAVKRMFPVKDEEAKQTCDFNAPTSCG
jgi:hypothetical protein